MKCSVCQKVMMASFRIKGQLHPHRETSILSGSRKHSRRNLCTTCGGSEAKVCESAPALLKIPVFPG